MKQSDPDKNYLEFKERFKNMSDEELIEIFNKDKNNPGWTNSRAMFQGALHEEIEDRKLNIEKGA